jgi:hypothetical protein
MANGDPELLTLQLPRRPRDNAGGRVVFLVRCSPLGSIRFLAPRRRLGAGAARASRPISGAEAP